MTKEEQLEKCKKCRHVYRLHLGHCYMFKDVMINCTKFELAAQFKDWSSRNN